MRDSTEFHSPASQALGCLQVRNLFAPLSCRTFAQDYFERTHFNATATGFEHLLTSKELPGLADRWQFKVAEDHSQARVLFPDSFSHDDAYKPGQILDGREIPRALAANRTVVLHNFELYSRRVGLLTLSLMRAFGVYAQANVYYSPHGLASAVHAHQDAQSVFIIQCEGRKHWQLFAPPQRWRLRYNQRGKAGDVAPDAELTQPLFETTLVPGDVLFLPRGVYHRTSTLIAPEAPLRAASSPSTDPSLHVTVGVETDTDDWTWLALLKDASTALALPGSSSKLDTAQWHDEKLREALPLPLSRPQAGFAGSAPHASAWFARARELISQHVGARPEPDRLKRALDGALRKRQEHVDKKRLQVIDFLAMNQDQQSL